MKKSILLAMLLSVSSIGLASNLGTQLFMDNFNRAISQINDIDASTTGMSGSLAPLTYVESGDDSDAALAGLTNIENNQLQLADGSNMSVLYLDHNFIDSAITDAGGLRVGFTIIADYGAGTTINHYCGFGIGNTLAECQAAGFDYNNPGFRGRINNQPGSSDFWVGWCPNAGGTLQVFKNGPTSNDGENYDIITGLALTGNDRMELELYFSDFNDGTPVIALVFWNGNLMTTDTFNWDSDGLLENYLGINCRQGIGFAVDDLAIDAVYYDRASNPSPADQATKVAPGTVALQWDKGLGATVKEHLLYVTTELNDQGEPNFVQPAAMYTAKSLADSANPISFDITLDYDQTVYWRVDEVFDANGVTGPVWTFETVKSVPVIITQPQNTLYYPNQQDAILNCVFTSLSQPTVAWYRSSSPATPVSTAAPAYNSETKQYTSTLSFELIQVSHEDAYYCVIENLSGPENSITSEIANLGIKRLVAHWPMDQLAGGVYEDIAGDHDADPNIAPTPDQFIAGVDPSETNQALYLMPQGQAAANSGIWIPSAYTGEVTFSAWVQLDAIGSWQGIVSNRTGTGVDSANIWFEIRPNGILQLGVPGVVTVQSELLPLNEWIHVAGTAGSDGVFVYINGDQKGIYTEPVTISTLELPVYIGALNLQADGIQLANPLTGAIDDVKIFNYALSQKEIVDLLYYDIVEKPVCLNPDDPALAFDFNQDCYVDLYDLAIMANNWLACNLFPDFVCQ